MGIDGFIGMRKVVTAGEPWTVLEYTLDDRSQIIIIKNTEQKSLTARRSIGIPGS